MLDWLLFSAISFTVLVAFLISLTNYLDAPLLKIPTVPPFPSHTTLSVLIPARNEAENLPRLLSSLKEQSLNPLEILLLDDCSEDDTSTVIADYQEKLPHLGYLQGKPLPRGWKGKNWACHQLSLKAKGDYLLFLDADVILSPRALESALIMANQKHTDLLSIFPSQETISFGEKLVIPLMYWILLAFLPLRLVYKSQNPLFRAANGQFKLFTRQAYMKSGGHAGVASAIVEDMALAFRVKAADMNLLTLLGGELIYCRMYHNFKDACRGFTRSFFPGFSLQALPFTLLLLFFTLPFFLPLAFAFMFPFYFLPLFFILFTRLLINRLSGKLSLFFTLLFHPLQMLLLVYLGLRSVIKTKRGTLTWKNRLLD